MNCPQCEGSKYKARNLRRSYDIKDDTVEVMAEINACTDCGFESASIAQMSSLQKIASDEYRKKYSLLTSEQIKSLRTSTGMTQVEFSKYLGVGDASVARWETFQIQDKSMDNLIRRSVVNAGEESVWIVSAHKTKESTGNRNLSLPMLKELAVRMFELGESPLFALKMMFYADFHAFRTIGRSITGSPYVRLEYGPGPENFYALLQALKMDRRLVDNGGNNWIVKIKSNMELFDDQEKQAIKDVEDFIKKVGKKNVLDLSHKEPAFKETRELHAIDYKLASKLIYPKSINRR